MGLFDSTTTIHFDAQFTAAVDRIATALSDAVPLLKGIAMQLDDALNAIKQVGDDQAVATATLLAEVGKVGDAVNTLEQQIRDAVSGTLSAAQEDALNAALAEFKANTQGITDAAAAAKAATDDAADGTAT